MIDLLIDFIYYLPIAAAGYGLAHATNAVHNRFSTQKAAQ